MAWRFRPGLWPSLATAAGLALFLTAGYWQVSRGLQKQALLLQYDKAGAQAPLSLSATSSALARAEPRVAQVQGEYLSEQQLLLDNQVQGSKPGYDVWTPLRLADGVLVIVDRGWLPQTASRSELPPLPAPSGQVALSGYWRALPQPAMRLGSGECGKPNDAATRWPRIVEYPTAADLRCLYGERVVAGELLLAPEVPGGFVRDWRALPAEMPPARHYGYAAQWFAFAATLLGIFIKLNLKRTR